MSRNYRVGSLSLYLFVFLTCLFCGGVLLRFWWKWRGNHGKNQGCRSSRLLPLHLLSNISIAAPSMALLWQRGNWTFRAGTFPAVDLIKSVAPMIQPSLTPETTPLPCQSQLPLRLWGRIGDHWFSASAWGLRFAAEIGFLAERWPSHSADTWSCTASVLSSSFQTLSVDPNFQSNFPCNPKLLPGTVKACVVLSGFRDVNQQEIYFLTEPSLCKQFERLAQNIFSVSSVTWGVLLLASQTEVVLRGANLIMSILQKVLTYWK